MTQYTKDGLSSDFVLTITTLKKFIPQHRHYIVLLFVLIFILLKRICEKSLNALYILNTQIKYV